MTRWNVEGQAWTSLLRLLELGASCSVSAAPRVVPAVVLPTSCLSASLTAAHSHQLRHFSSKAALFHDALTLPSRKGLFDDAVTVNQLLPNRKEFSAQFSPHGLWLVPKAILAQANTSGTGAESAARQAAARAYWNAMRAQPTTMAMSADAPSMEAADKTKVWRRLKIKKHKIKKRRKEARHKTDK